MLKQSASRKLRGRSLKVKHAVQILVLVAIFVWFLYHLKHSDEKEVMKMGRKQLKPRADEVEKLQAGGEQDGDEEMDEEGVQVEVEHDQRHDFIDELLVEA